MEKVPINKQKIIVEFLKTLYSVYKKLYFTYLEINPLVVTDKDVIPLDLAAKVDETAGMNYEVESKWKSVDGENLEFPRPFGSSSKSEEEEYVQRLDAGTGASLKLTILNPEGRIWTMVAGGGASVVYADTVCDLGGASELANYGEYSGDPSQSETYEYARTILKLMTKGKPREDGKVLIIGGSIANFTDVASTFKGIVRAIRKMAQKLKEHKVKIYVRRGGPNYMEGLRMMRDLGRELEVPIEVYGPETHITYIVSLALGKETQIEYSMKPKPWKSTNDLASLDTQEDFFTQLAKEQPQSQSELSPKPAPSENGVEKKPYMLFNSKTQCIVYGLQARAVQGMLDFDHICGKQTRSVACIVYPFSENHLLKLYWGAKEIVIPVYKHLSEAVEKHKEADVLINFASCRSVFQSCKEALSYNRFKTIAIIAEGVPENHTRKIIKMAKDAGVTIIGPATVGGVKPGCFKIGNTGLT